MPSSLIFAGLVVLWLLILVPTVARRRQEVPHPSTAALSGRVLKRRPQPPAARRRREEVDAVSSGGDAVPGTVVEVVVPGPRTEVSVRRGDRAPEEPASRAVDAGRSPGGRGGGPVAEASAETDGVEPSGADPGPVGRSRGSGTGGSDGAVAEGVDDTESGGADGVDRGASDVEAGGAEGGADRGVGTEAASVPAEAPPRRRWWQRRRREVADPAPGAESEVEDAAPVAADGAGNDDGSGTTGERPAATDGADGADADVAVGPRDSDRSDETVETVDAEGRDETGDADRVGVPAAETTADVPARDVPVCDIDEAAAPEPSGGDAPEGSGAVAAAGDGSTDRDEPATRGEDEAGVGGVPDVRPGDPTSSGGEEHEGGPTLDTAGATADPGDGADRVPDRAPDEPPTQARRAELVRRAGVDPVSAGAAVPSDATAREDEPTDVQTSAVVVAVAPGGVSTDADPMPAGPTAAAPPDAAARPPAVSAAPTDTGADATVVVHGASAVAAPSEVTDEGPGAGTVDGPSGAAGPDGADTDASAAPSADAGDTACDTADAETRTSETPDAAAPSADTADSDPETSDTRTSDRWTPAPATVAAPPDAARPAHRRGVSPAGPDRVPDGRGTWDQPEPRYRPGRGGFDPAAAAAAARAKYAFRQRAVLLLLVLAVGTAVAAFVVGPVVWWVHGAVDLVLVSYLVHLRRQVRMEEAIRARRSARMAGARRSGEADRALDDAEDGGPALRGADLRLRDLGVGITDGGDDPYGTDEDDLDPPHGTARHHAPRGTGPRIGGIGGIGGGAGDSHPDGSRAGGDHRDTHHGDQGGDHGDTHHGDHGGDHGTADTLRPTTRGGPTGTLRGTGEPEDVPALPRLRPSPPLAMPSGTAPVQVDDLEPDLPSWDRSAPWRYRRAAGQ